MHVLIVEDGRGSILFPENGPVAEDFAVTAAATPDGAHVASGPPMHVRTSSRPTSDCPMTGKGRAGTDVRTRPVDPVIILMARHEVEHEVRPLEVGANDYATEPHPVAEVPARVRATLRATLRAAEQQSSSEVVVADLRPRWRRVLVSTSSSLRVGGHCPSCSCGTRTRCCPGRRSWPSSGVRRSRRTATWSMSRWTDCTANARSRGSSRCSSPCVARATGSPKTHLAPSGTRRGGRWADRRLIPVCPVASGANGAGSDGVARCNRHAVPRRYPEPRIVRMTSWPSFFRTWRTQTSTTLESPSKSRPQICPSS